MRLTIRCMLCSGYHASATVYHISYENYNFIDCPIQRNKAFYDFLIIEDPISCITGMINHFRDKEPPSAVPYAHCPSELIFYNCIYACTARSFKGNGIGIFVQILQYGICTSVTHTYNSIGLVSLYKAFRNSYYQPDS